MDLKDVILKKNGEPFGSKGAAETEFKKLELDSSAYQVEKIDLEGKKGYCICLVPNYKPKPTLAEAMRIDENASKKLKNKKDKPSSIMRDNGSSFTSKEEAFDVFCRMELDSNEYVIAPHANGGFFIKLDRLEDKVKPKPMSIDLRRVTKGNDKFLNVIIAAPTSPNDLKIIPITVRGATLLCRRGVKICLPESYVNVLKNAIEGIWENGVRFENQRFPYTVVSEATRKDFQKMFPTR